jgi:hypothetical protein
LVVQLADKTKRYEIYAIITIITIIVAGIWIFGFDDELFGTKQIKLDSNPEQIPQKPLVQSPTIVQKMYDENLQAKPDTEPTEKPTIPKQKPVIQHATNKNPDLTDSLENAMFKLDVDGTAYEGSPALTKSAEITLNLTPIKDTELEKFDVSNGRIIIGTTAISFDKGTAEIKGTAILISVSNDDSLDPFFTIVGTLDDPILSDKDSTQNVSFLDQLVYFGKKDETTPHHFNVNGELNR